MFKKILIFTIMLLLIAPNLVAVGTNLNKDKIKNLYLSNGEPFDGYTLFGPEYSKYTYLLDINGKIIHKWESNYIQGLANYLLENGDLLRLDLPHDNVKFRSGGVAGRVEKFDNKSNLLWEFEYSDDNHCSHHDIEPLPNGNVLLIAWEYKTEDEVNAAGRNTDYPRSLLHPDHIIEVKPTGPSSGDIVWEWHVWDHLIQDYDPAKNNYGIVEDHPELIDINYRNNNQDPDWNHINSIDYNEEYDQILLCVKNFDEIWVIDHSTTSEEAAGHTGGNSGKGGDLLYRWGNPQSYRAGNESDRKFFSQHGANWVEKGCPGEGHILVFNNGIGRDHSSVDEIVPPLESNGNYQYTPGESYGPDEQLWIYINVNLVSWSLSNAQRLPNGNTLICSGNQGLFLEVTSDKEIVWKYRNILPNPFSNGVGRIFRYAKDYPGIPKYKTKTIVGNGLNSYLDKNEIISEYFNCNLGNVKSNILYVDDDGTADYTSIQDAIDHANDGDTVFVFDGIYYENVIVDKSIDLIGLNKENTIIDAQKNGTTVMINADGCLLSNFSLINCEGQINYDWQYAVVKLNGVKDVVVKNNVINAGEVQTGPYIAHGSIDLGHCTNCEIINNSIAQNTSNPSNYGIVLHDNSTDNNIVENQISNYYFGIGVHSNGNNYYNIISKNYIHHNTFGIGIENGYNEILNNVIEYNTEVGINIQSGYHNIISFNTIQYNGGERKFLCGIELMGDSLNNNNIVSDNIIAYNTPCGLQTEYSDGNIITRNNFIENYGIGDSPERWWGNAYVHIQKGLFKKDTFKNNYWSDRVGARPKMIYGYLEIIPYSFFIKWINVDWHPAKEPYDI